MTGGNRGPSDKEDNARSDTETYQAAVDTLKKAKPFQFLEKHWRNFRRDVFGQFATVQPVPAWILTALLSIVVYLTITYAPGAYDAGNRPHGQSGNVIPVEWGYFTIIAVMAVAIVMGLEYIVRRRARNAKLFEKYGLLPSWLRLILNVIGTISWFFFSLPSIAWSFVDYLLARPVAVLAGAALPDWRIRYIWGFGLLIASLFAGLYVPPLYGLYAVLAGLVAVIAIVRRWSWVEHDRNRFLIERSGRAEAQRLGFKEDLRDEALLALCFLFLLIPLGLRQVQLFTCIDGTCAFGFRDNGSMPSDAFDQFVLWIGYFGAELAKSVPFVDWSEVFHVANNSPIEPKTELGAQIVFVMRATLDLLLLAAVLQAVEIAGRLRDQREAFQDNQLPILEPFAEREELERLASGLEEALDVHPTKQAAIADFPTYDADRLREIVDSTDPQLRLSTRKAAAALMVHQHSRKNLKRGSEEEADGTETTYTTEHFLTERAQSGDAFGKEIAYIAGGVAKSDTMSERERHRPRLIELLRNENTHPTTRKQAALTLGRLPKDDATNNLLLEQLSDRRESPASLALRAACAAAVIRHVGDAAFDPLKGLAATFREDDGKQEERDELIAVMATAHALSRIGTGQEISSHFDEAFTQHTAIAANIQKSPMDIETAKEPEIGENLHQTVMLTPGEGPCPKTFKMGTPKTDDKGHFSERDAHGNPVEITMDGPFSIGRFPVRMGEYTMLLGMTQTPLPKELSDWIESAMKESGLDEFQLMQLTANWPVAHVSWMDAKAFCAILQSITGDVFRLPSEAEWEYACRADSDTRYSWGDDYSAEKANSQESVKGNRTLIDTYRPNDFGLRDMHGNVYEWCLDPWHETYEHRPQNSRPWIHHGDFSRRVLRGGSWSYTSLYLRSASRRRFQPDSRNSNIGFRVVRMLTS